MGPVRDDHAEPPKPRSGWLRCSDDTMWECSFEAVLQEGAGAFMLFYERVVMPRQSVYMSNSPRSSEETVRPEGVQANGSYTSLVNGDATQGEVAMPIPTKVIGPRVIHRVSAQPSSRSSSMSPPDRDPVPHPEAQPRASGSISLPNGHVNGDVQQKAEDSQSALVRPLSPHKQATSPTPSTPARPATRHHTQAASSRTERQPSQPRAVDLRA